MRAAVMALLLLAMGAADRARAADLIRLDGQRLRIAFAVDTLLVGRVEGRFAEARGEMRLDRTALYGSGLEVRVGTRSIAVRDGRFEEQLRSPRFFDVERHPEMVFVSTSIEEGRGGSGRISGSLTLLGLTRPLSLALEVRRSASPDGKAGSIAGFVASGRIRRSAWGMTSLVPLVADEVELRIEASVTD